VVAVRLLERGLGPRHLRFHSCPDPWRPAAGRDHTVDRLWVGSACRRTRCEGPDQKGGRRTDGFVRQDL